MFFIQKFQCIYLHWCLFLSLVRYLILRFHSNFAVLSACLLFQRATRDGSGDFQQHAGSTQEYRRQLRILTITSLSLSLSPALPPSLPPPSLYPSSLLNRSHGPSNSPRLTCGWYAMNYNFMYSVAASVACSLFFLNFSFHHSLLPMIVCVCIHVSIAFPCTEIHSYSAEC